MPPPLKPPTNPPILGKIDMYMKELNLKNSEIPEIISLPSNKTNKFNIKNIICIKNVPINVDETLLYSIIKQYGNVTNLHKSRSDNCPYYFAECLTTNDYEAILQGMKNNPYNIQVDTKKVSKKNENFTKQNINQSTPLRENNRPFNKHSELNIKEENYNCNGLNNFDKSNNYKEEYNNSLHSSEKDLSSSTNSQMEIPPSTSRKHGSCRMCHKISKNICSKCDEFYCSIECQTKDWPNHRFFCFKMPSLIALEDEEEKNNISKNSKLQHEKNSIKKPIKTSSKKEICSKEMENDLKNNKSFPNYISSSKKEMENDLKNNKSFPNYISSSKKEMENDLKSNKSFPNNITSIRKSLPLTNKPKYPKSGQNVVLTYVEKTNVVFIRSNEKDDNIEYLKIITTIIKSSKNSKFLKQLPNIRDYVVAHDGEEWFRAIVLDNNNPDKIKIAYIDFGNCEYKKLSELKELPEDCKNLNCFTTAVYLKFLEEIPIFTEFSNYMNEMVNSLTELTILFNENDIKNNKFIVDLFNLQTKEHINKKCLDLLKTQMADNLKDTFLFEDITKEFLPNGNNILVHFVDNSMISNGLVSCIAYNHVNELDQLNIEIKEYANKIKEQYTPKTNEMCIAKYYDCSDDWYRAYCCEETNEDSPVLLFIDYGNTCPIQTKNIRKFDKKFAVPCRTQEYFISGLEYLLGNEESNIEFERRLQELVPLHFKTIVHKVETKGDIKIIHFPKLIGILQNEGFIRK